MDYFSSDKLEIPHRGDLLISEPYLPDPNFERTVVFLCEHDDNGSFGFVLNRKANVQLGEMIDEAASSDADVYIGGPVQRDTLHFLHKNPLIEHSQETGSGIFWGGDFDFMLSLINTRAIDQTDYRFFLGYSGWAPGQLMDELRAKSWIILSKATPEMIFEWDNQDLWEACLKAKGGKYKLMSNYPKDPRMN